MISDRRSLTILTFMLYLLTSACARSAEHEGDKRDLSEAYGCYVADGVPMIKISSAGMEIPEIDYTYKKVELVIRMNGKLWLHTIPAYSIVKQSDGSFAFGDVYKDKDINDSGYYTRFWQENGVKYLENYAYPEGPLFLYKSANCGGLRHDVDDALIGK